MGLTEKEWKPTFFPWLDSLRKVLNDVHSFFKTQKVIKGLNILRGD